MPRFVALLTLVCSLLTIPAVADEAKTTTVSGALAYRERIALLPGAVATVTLSDVTLADTPAKVIVEWRMPLRGLQVPVPFGCSVPHKALEERRRYAVRGTLHGPDGRLLWTTDTVHPVDPEEVANDLGILLLKRAEREPDTLVRFHCGETEVAARFSGELLMLTVDGETHELSRQPSGSGAKYVSDDADVLFWEKGGQALIEIGGEALPECERIEE